MQTLAPPTPIWPELSTPSCEQVTTGSVTSEEKDGKLRSGGGAKPKPLQGEGDTSDDPERDKETGAEGGGN